MYGRPSEIQHTFSVIYVVAVVAKRSPSSLFSRQVPRVSLFTPFQIAFSILPKKGFNVMISIDKHIVHKKRYLLTQNTVNVPCFPIKQRTQNVDEIQQNSTFLVNPRTTKLFTVTN